MGGRRGVGDIEAGWAKWMGVWDLAQFLKWWVMVQGRVGLEQYYIIKANNTR